MADYTLLIVQTSYIQTGNDVGVIYTLPISQISYAQTGIDIALLKTSVIPVVQDSYVMSVNFLDVLKRKYQYQYYINMVPDVVDLLDSANQKFDNTVSGLTADKTKDAIDELKSISDAKAIGDNTDVTNTTPVDRDVFIFDGVTDNVYENRALVEADISDLYVYTNADWDHNQINNYSIDQHRIINDAGTTTTELFSASKINTELNTKEDIAEKGVANGYCELDSNTFVPEVNIPINFRQVYIQNSEPVGWEFGDVWIETV